MNIVVNLVVLVFLFMVIVIEKVEEVVGSGDVIVLSVM